MKNILFVLTLCLLISCEQSNTLVVNHIDDDILQHSNDYQGDWITYGKNYGENRHSELDLINKETVKDLELAWSLNLNTKRGIETTPLVANGIMYLTGPWSLVYSVDAKTGELLWSYDPKVSKSHGEVACCDVANRGLAMYKGKLYLGALDGRLIALDASNGEVIWEKNTVEGLEGSYTITGAPRVFDGKVFIGNGGAEYGVRGFFSAYNAESGEMEWRFYTVPGNPEDGFEHPELEEAAKTWTGEWWKYGGGGTAWDSFVYDPDEKLVYVGTGNGSPWNREIRSPGGGDNLYLSSILALDVKTGKLKWHYQTTPGETWDYTAVQPLMLADLEINGENRKVIMQAPKNGFFYVLDRHTGELISAEKFVYANWAEKVDLETGRPVETSFARHINENVEIYPGPFGGHNWQAMAYNPNTGLVYIPAREMSMPYGKESAFDFEPKQWNTGTELVPGASGKTNGKELLLDSVLQGESYGKLLAWDPVKNTEVWSHKQNNVWNSGVLSVNNLIFQGDAEGHFVAFDAFSGERLWTRNLNTGIIAPPITYMVDGEQYITMPVGWGGAYGNGNKHTEQINPGTIYTFKLNGNAKYPEFEKALQKNRTTLTTSMSKDDISEGGEMYTRYCMQCHNLGNGGGTIPDLTYSTETVFNMYENILLDGVFLPKGMPSFEDRLNKKDVEKIKAYVLHTASTLEP